MLINRVKEEDDETVQEKETIEVDNNLEEYHTAHELFEIMAKSHPHSLDVFDRKTLTPMDLIILYENMDLGTKLMSNDNDDSNEAISKAPNQYVETIIYNDDLDSEDSDIYQAYSSEDLHNVFTVNNERIDLLSNITSFENTLCHKFGNIQIKKSDFSNEYKNHCLLNDSYIKEQLQSVHAMTNPKQSDSSVLPTSLLDYICCKRLDDNYNFYMDNVISYVQNTIEQLKRISNGDYLTDRVKEKWREVDNSFDSKTNSNDNVIALSRTHNAPLPIVGKISCLKNTWDEIVHSEMDVRCLTKLLEKKIVMEVPKILCGSYGFLGKHFNDNLTLSCNKVKNLITDEGKERHTADVVVLKLQKPEHSLVIPNTNSIIVLKTLASSITEKDTPDNNKQIFALHFNKIYSDKTEPRIVELEDKENEITHENDASHIQINVGEDTTQKFCPYTAQELNKDLIPSDELGYAIRQLNIQHSVLEESELCSYKKRKSPTRVRIKSPYENKSHILDERKRKRLLEIREKREKKKIAMNENCKITKHKYVKGAIMAQSSNSVTKLSITNKSFYNSIYGQTNTENKNYRNIVREEKQDNIPGIDIQECEEDLKRESTITSPGKDSLKYINRSYYLDDADTEITHLQMKSNSNQDDINEILTPSTSILSSDGGNFTSLKCLTNSSITDLSGTDTSSLQQNILLEEITETTNMQNKYQTTPRNLEILVPSNTPKHEDTTKNEELKKVTASVECRRSIDKIYDLMNKITVSPITYDSKVCETENINSSVEKSFIRINSEETNLRTSDSDTSVTRKLQIISSNPSNFGIEKGGHVVKVPRKSICMRSETSSTVVPKVIISSKLETERKDKTKKEHKKAEFKVADNPLKAISQLLHEFDNVQKTRYKNGKDYKVIKKPENTKLADTSSKQCANKIASQGSRNLKHNEQANTRSLKPLSPTKGLKISQQTSREVKSEQKKKLTDIIDEVKELRGEAIRGPSKLSSRIDNLAQPKKSYAQTYREDFSNRHTKNITPRMQKIIFSPVQEKTTKTSNKNRQRGGIEMSSALAKQSCVVGSSLEKTVKTKRSANSSPVRKDKPGSVNKMPKNIENGPDSLKNKMVVVENYLKNHFGEKSATCKAGDKIQNISRVPLIPNDIDIASLTSSPLAEESTTIGHRLHTMISSKLKTIPVTAFVENDNLEIKMDNGGTVESVELLIKSDTTSSNFDHPVDILEDKNIITAVACISNQNSDNKFEKERNANMIRHEVQEYKSCNEVQKLENALYHQLSKGAFQKRLRMKNLTLTPKHSTQHMFVLQSEDAKSLILKPKLSQNLDLSATDTVSKLNILSRKAVNFSLPLQIATVGYVFPTYQSFSNNSNKINVVDNNSIDNNFHSTIPKNNERVDKTVQCYKGDNERQGLKQNMDTNDTGTLTMNTVCTKTLSEILNTNDDKLSILSNEKIKADDKMRSDVYKSKNDITKISENEIMKSSENICNSTSLDILVGLLNEIKKITACQSDLVLSSNDAKTILESKELKVFLNNATAVGNSANQSLKCSISSSSLDSQFQMQPNIYSLHLQSNIENYMDNFKSTEDDNRSKYITCIKPVLIDKEINVHISPNEYVNRCTDIQSRLFPSTVDHSTGIVKSLISLVNSNSSEPYSNCINVLYSNSIFNNLNGLPNFDKETSLASLKPDDQKIEEIVTKRNVLKNVMFRTDEKINPLRNTSIVPEKIISNTNNFNTLQEFDPLLKMKRDILVTVYSILVFTVFAALTMPEIIFPV